MPSDTLSKTINKTEFTPDKSFILSLLDADLQAKEEQDMLDFVLKTVSEIRIKNLERQNAGDAAQILLAQSEKQYTSAQYLLINDLEGKIARRKIIIEQNKKLLSEPYFARMDLYDNLNRYIKLYIGKKGDRALGITDWRAPVAKKYYQKSSLSFTHNNYVYKVILRRALRIAGAKLTGWKNEYLNVRDFLTKKEIAGRDESVVFDPFLKEILAQKKESRELTDIVETIQEKQYGIITLPKQTDVIVQGCAGSGKTMIMLHRLSYLMYNNPDIKPGHILVLTPSDSFNDFIDELCAVLEIDKVKTDTVHSYYTNLLAARGIDLKINTAYKENPDYTSYIYSQEFVKDAQTQIDKLIGGIKGFFTCAEFDGIKNAVLDAYRTQSAEYSKLKNAPKHIIRAVLGEIKLSKQQDVYYTREFRRLMSETGVVADFLQLNLNDYKFSDHYYFLSRYREFFESFKHVSKNAAAVRKAALADIDEAIKTITEHIAKLKKHTLPGGRYIFADKIALQTGLLGDYNRARTSVEKIFSGFDGAYDLLTAIKSGTVFLHSGNAVTDSALAKFLYGEIIRKKKIKYKTRLKMYQSDLYAMTLLLHILGMPLKHGQSYVFIDEGQDLSPSEYRLIRGINDTSAFNIFGDLAQNISDVRGLKDWQECNAGAKVYTLSQNYRNTNQIVGYVKENLGIKMQSIGFDGQDVYLAEETAILQVFEDKGGLKAIIAPGEKLDMLYALSPARFSLLSNAGKISRKKINLLTVEQSKGLEFSVVAVFDKQLDINNKYIAYTRALKELILVRD